MKNSNKNPQKFTERKCEQKNFHFQNLSQKNLF